MKLFELSNPKKGSWCDTDFDKMYLTIKTYLLYKYSFSAICFIRRHALGNDFKNNYLYNPIAVLLDHQCHVKLQGNLLKQKQTQYLSVLVSGGAQRAGLTSTA